ncbi:Phage tail assembly chaperone protein, E, or 41 or 14 [Pseudomonas cuatrocienegasensis]|uniref:Phage tail assembly chaperone protein, E, or 41 or 14 n=1 Tax=Pseudomonas cuatrocienegasensis TaxID=543360 RepID=A0ABY1BR06_9PSED|nr:MULTISPECIES: phage tail assembly protein [Pseudomonas]OEC32888.1 hypothetical protein A7D25_21840 [Pseudomonas sp. 21C1]SER41511.1 Phage tail assembly chaperone protein, E, or 41 or 14 [Pseudomonas cuatrocienegasensis]
MTWKPEPLTLQWPVTTEAGETLTVLELRAFNVDEHRAALARAGDDEDARFEQLAVLATGHPLEVIEELKRPDYVTLSKRLSEYVNMPASFFSGKKPENLDDAPLLVPIKVMGRLVERLALEVPTMKATKVMVKMKTDHDRTDFISAHCTGIAPQEITRLSIPDWTQLQVRLSDFLNKPAAFFQSATSK